MHTIKVDNFKGFTCLHCNKNLEEEKRIIKDENTFGVYWCCKCYEAICQKIKNIMCIK